MIQSIKNVIHRICGTKQLQREISYIYAMQKFQLAICDCEWLKHKAFSIGDYAMDADALYKLFRILDGFKPNNVLEFGLGQSSRLVHQYAIHYKTNAITVEHDKDWITFVKNNLPYSINVEQADLEKKILNNKETTSYKELEIFLQKNQKKYNFIICDAPFIYNEKHIARAQILELIPNYIDKNNFCLFLHDTERFQIRATLGLLYKKLQEYNIEYISKDYKNVKMNSTIVCSLNNKFLTTL